MRMQRPVTREEVAKTMLGILYRQAVTWRQVELAQGPLINLGRWLFRRSDVAGGNRVEPGVGIGTKIGAQQTDDVFEF